MGLSSFFYSMIMVHKWHILYRNRSQSEVTMIFEEDLGNYFILHREIYLMQDIIIHIFVS